jgi:exosortase A
MPNPTVAANDVPELRTLPEARPAQVTTTTWLQVGATLVLLLGSFALLYWRVLVSLVDAWANDGNYSHGFLIVPIALYLVWERREQLTRLVRKPSYAGLLLVLAGVGLLTAGTLGAELFLTRVSILFVVAGTIVFLLGWSYLRELVFPVTFLLLMIPLPALVFNQVALPLQLFASRAGEMVLMALGIPVLREGNVIVLAHTTLEVAEACSGIRSLVSLITLGVVYGYFVDSRFLVRAIIALSTIPVAILANGLRVAGTGVAAQYFGADAAEGFFHTFSGWVMFIVAFIAIFGVREVLVRSIRLGERYWPRTRMAV